MAGHHELGRRGEAAAADWLEARGYAIVARNWRCQRAEIDIIARQGDTLVFVEVKTRRNSRFGEPDAFVSEQKAAMMADAAGVFAEQHGHTGEIRFDIIAVLPVREGEFDIRHYEDAFFPGWGE